MASSTIFESLVWLDPGSNHSGPLVNTQLILTAFSSYAIHLLSSFYLWKKLWENYWRGGKRQEYRWTQTLSWGLRLFCSVKCFPERVEIVTFPRRGIRIYHRIIFGYYNLMVCRVFYVYVLLWQYPLGSTPHRICQLLQTISLLGRWSTSGFDRGIAHFLTATRNTIKGVGGKNKEQTNNMSLG